jgi:hypothetical protein
VTNELQRRSRLVWKPPADSAPLICSSYAVAMKCELSTLNKSIPAQATMALDVALFTCPNCGRAATSARLAVAAATAHPHQPRAFLEEAAKLGNDGSDQARLLRAEKALNVAVLKTLEIGRQLLPHAACLLVAGKPQ